MPSDLPDDKMAFGQRVRNLRNEAGLSIRRTAEAAGISSTFLADLENGRRMPARAAIGRLAAALKVDASELLKYDPREGMAEIVAAVNANPTALTVFAHISQQIRSGQISSRRLATLAARIGRKKRVAR